MHYITYTTGIILKNAILHNHSLYLLCFEHCCNDKKASVRREKTKQASVRRIVLELLVIQRTNNT